MNEKNTRNTKKPNEKRKLGEQKGFYVALYSAIGVFLLIAVAAGYNSLHIQPNDSKTENAAKNNQTANAEFTEDSKTVGRDADSYTNYLTPDLNGSLAANGIDARATAPAPTANSGAKPMPTPVIPKLPQNPAPTAGAAAPTPKPTEQADAEIGEITEIFYPISLSEVSESAEISLTEDNALSVGVFPVGEGIAPQLYAFDESQKMAWPLTGEIVMDFSADKLIYDKTLEHYRTNNVLCIAAPVGTNVKAAASGTVREIYTTKESGNTVVLDHGNGWVTVYSQLQEGVVVAVGEEVEKGQTIGGVSSPSIYGTMLGNHLGFAVYKDSVAKNPKAILEKR